MWLMLLGAMGECYCVAPALPRGWDAGIAGSSVGKNLHRCRLCSMRLPV